MSSELDGSNWSPPIAVTGRGKASTVGWSPEEGVLVEEDLGIEAIGGSQGGDG
jgi:hypothetical protein